MLFDRIENKALLFIMLFLLYSCSAANLSAGGNKKPGWVKERPVSKEYYIGIGMARKSQDNYIRIAKNNALSDMISEISVNISSNSVLQQFEDYTGFKEKFESYTRMSMKDELEGYELVDSYDGNDNYWVYYRLSIDEYQRLKREKLERAKDLAKDFFEKARDAESNYDIHNAINYYVKSFEAIKAHLDDDLSVFLLNRGRVNLGNAIYQNLQEIFSNLKVVSAKEVFQIKALSAQNPAVKAIVYYEKNDRQRIEGLPFRFSFPDLDIERTETVHSHSNGEIISSIAQSAPRGKQRKMMAALNTDVYFGEETEGSLLKQMFRLKGSVPYGYLTVNVADLTAFFMAEETEFGKPSAGQSITDIFRKALSENFFSFVPDKKGADVIVKVTANTVEGKKLDQFNLHTAYLSCNISITNAKTNEEVYSTGLQNIKGMKTGSFQMAAQDARTKAEIQVQQKIIPELRQIKF